MTIDQNRKALLLIIKKKDGLFGTIFWALLVHLGYMPKGFRQYRPICIIFATFSISGLVVELDVRVEQRGKLE